MIKGPDDVGVIAIGDRASPVSFACRFKDLVAYQDQGQSGLLGAGIEFCRHIRASKSPMPLHARSTQIAKRLDQKPDTTDRQRDMLHDHGLGDDAFGPVQGANRM